MGVSGIVRIAAALLLGADSAMAAEASDLKAPAAPAYSAEYQACVAKTGGVDPRLLACDEAELQRQDKTLNLIYRRLEANLTPARKAALQKAERDWLAFRLSNCRYEQSVDIGYMAAPLDFADCSLRANDARIEAVRRYLDMELRYGVNSGSRK